MHFQNQKSRLHLRRLSGGCAFILALASILSCNFIPTLGAQTNSQAPLTEDERREAHQLSVTFTKRLGETLDFEVVMRELFVPDAAERYIALEKKKAAQEGYPFVILDPGIFVDVALLDKASADDWRKLYVQTNNFILLGLVHGLRSNADFEKLKRADLYPATVIRLLDRDPLLKNLILKNARSRNFGSVADMQSAAATLARANELTRRDAQPIDLEEAFLRLAMRNPPSPARGSIDKDKIRDLAIHVEIERNADLLAGATGERIIMVTTMSLHGLALVRSGGRLKVLWAYPLGD
jgi:hypothetical protein